MKYIPRKKFFNAYTCGVLALAAGLSLGISTGALAEDDKYATAAELGLMHGFPPPPDKQVTKANVLMTSPYIRWSYQHMRMFYPSTGIKAADVAVPLKKDIDPNFDKGVDVTAS